MLKRFLYFIVESIAKIHDRILQLNNNYELAFTDKQLHFLVIGLLGLALFLVVNPIFKSLAKKGKVGVISWCYTVTVIIVLTFAIEIGQYITGTGSMEFADIAFGIVGFLVLHLIWTVLSFLVRKLAKVFSERKTK